MQASSFLMRLPGPSAEMEVFRATDIVWKDGKPVQIAVTPYKMVGNIQPTQGRDLLLVPEAWRTKEVFTIFTEQNQKTPKLNDHVKIEGFKYQVQHSENWGTYTKIIVTKEDSGTEASN